MSERIGRYELLHRIAAGGMGEIFFARLVGVEDFQKPLVVKRMLPSFSARSDVVTMFLDEARLVAKLDHPAIVQVFELGEEHGQYYLAMELVDGPNVAHLLAHSIKIGHPLPIVMAAYIVARAAEGLDFAHHQLDPVSGKPLGLVHRDVSPQNILVGRHGEVKIADFGVAKAALRATQTEPGAIKGKAAYMSPEQCRGDELDRRTDVFALGIVLHELLSRENLYASGSAMQAMQSILLDAPEPPSSANPQVDPDLDAITLKALAKLPAARYSTAAAMARALDDWIAGQHVPDQKPMLAAWIAKYGAELGPLAGIDRKRLLETAPTARASEPVDATHVPPLAPQAQAHAPPPRGAGTRTAIRRSNLPPDSSSFVGREPDLAELDRLARGGARLITVTGQGGTGKTRLVRRHGHAVLEREAGEVWFVDLTRAEGLDSILSTVAAALSMVLGPGRSSEDTASEIGDWLARRGPLLLILDNFEQIVAHAGTTVGLWLDKANEARLVVTSRELLRLDGEQVMPLGALDEREGIQLFIERARAVRPRFSPTTEETASIATIVRELEGIPLAIELAAARMSAMTPAKLVERLPRRLDVLTTGRRDASARQATLRGAIDWSWRLLDPAEQAALAQISVFQGGFTLESAEAVLELPGSAQVIDVLQSLRDKSLLKTDAVGEELRYGVYESIREFAEERLTDQAGPVRTRHVRHYLELAESLLPGLDTEGGANRFDRLVLEQANLQAIHRRLFSATELTVERAVAGLRCVLALDAILGRRGPMARIVELLEPVFSSPLLAELSQREPKLICLALLARSKVALSGNMRNARADLEQALAIAARAKLPAEEGRAHAELGNLLKHEGEFSRAKLAYQQAQALVQRAGDRAFEGVIFVRLANIEADLDALDKARWYYEQALTIFREVGDLRYEAIALSNLALLATEMDQLEEGMAGALRAREIQRRLGDRNYQGMAEMLTGLITWYAGDPAGAQPIFRAGARLMRDVGALRFEAMIEGFIGGVEAELGDVEGAEARIGRAEAFLRSAGDRTSMMLVSTQRGYLELTRARQAAERGERELARSILDALEARLSGLTLPATSQGVRVGMRALTRRLQAVREAIG